MTDIDEGVRIVIPELCVESKKTFSMQRQGKPSFARVDGKDQKSFKALARMAAYEAMQEAGLPIYDEPLVLEATWYRLRPKSQRKHDAFPASAPDIKNHLAILEDALEKICYVNDSRIVTEHLAKRFCADGEPERVELHIYPAIPGYPYRRQASPPPEAQPCHPTSATTASEDGGGAEAR